jgi:chromosomal replication initiation ATPase DnaA
MAIRHQHPDDSHFARLTISTVGLEFGFPDLRLEAASRAGMKKPEVFARQIAAYLCQTVFDMSLPRVAELFARDRSTIVHALNVVEETRDDPVFNRKLTKAEDFLIQSAIAFRRAA